MLVIGYKVSIVCMAQFIWELNGILKYYLVRIANGGTPTLVQSCGNMTSIKNVKGKLKKAKLKLLSQLRDIP
jgi:hypothetical protein